MMTPGEKMLEKKLDSVIRELKEIRKEVVAARRMIMRQQRLQFPLISVEPEEDLENDQEEDEE